MKRNAISVIVPIALILAFSVAFAMSHKTAERGKALFKNPNFSSWEKSRTTLKKQLIFAL